MTSPVSSEMRPVITPPFGSVKLMPLSCWLSSSCSGVPACSGRRWPYDSWMYPFFYAVMV